MRGVSRDTRKTRWVARIHMPAGRVHLGYFRDWFEAVCARKAAENERSRIATPLRVAKDYPLRPCPYCQKLISNISKRGHVLKKGHYDQRKTCGDNRCHRLSLMRDTPRFEFKPTGPMDEFLYR